MFNLNIDKTLIDFFKLVLFPLLVCCYCESIKNFILFGIIFFDLYCEKVVSSSIKK